MAVSPGRSAQNFQKKEQEIKYISRLRDVPIMELLGILAYDCASKISKNAEEDFKFIDLIDDKNEEIKYNTAIYEEEAEEYIFNHTLEKLISAARAKGDHESAENVRILRSARAVIYYSNQEKA